MKGGAVLIFPCSVEGDRRGDTGVRVNDQVEDWVEAEVEPIENKVGLELRSRLNKEKVPGFPDVWNNR